MNTMTTKTFALPSAAALLLRLVFVTAIAVTLLASDDAWSQQTFDHFSTGFILDGAHSNVTCEGCHISGTFGPTNPSCNSCHSQSGLVRASSKPADHIATNGECSDCHITANWTVVTFMDHSSITGSCVSCHNGIQATGKTPNHISSNDQCDDCHTATAWAPAVFDLRAKMTRGVLVLEALDAASLRASEQEPDHHVLETAIDEVIDDRSELGFSAELLKQSHVRGDPGAMSGVDQVASLAHEITTTPEAPQAKVIDFFEALMARVEASQVKGKPKLKPLKKAAAKKSRKKKAASSKSK